MNREITTDLGNILSMINTRYDYGHGGSIASHFFWGLLGGALTNEEIEWYARDVESSEGYGEEDYESAVSSLTEFKQE